MQKPKGKEAEETHYDKGWCVHCDCWRYFQWLPERKVFIDPICGKEYDEEKAKQYERAQGHRH